MKSLPLFPNKFKKIGFVVIILSFLIPTVWRLIKGSGLPHAETIKTLVKVFSFIGFIMIVFSKEKIEDEFVNLCRLRAGAWSFFTVIVLYIIDLLISLASGSLPQSMGSILAQQCIFYILSFQSLKSGILTFKKK